MNVVTHDSIDDDLCPEGTSFLQFVGDNTDHDLATIDGKNTHHGLGAIAIANGKFNDKTPHRRPVPRDKRENWANVASNEGIPILEYQYPDKSALKSVCLKELSKEKFNASFTNLIWNCAHVFQKQCPNWSGYMSLKTNGTLKEKSYVTMLPIINLPATDMTSLYSLIVFVTKMSEKFNTPAPTITFDQPLYVKAYEIVATKKLNIFVRLGGFHQLMSFLGSIGCLMEGSGLREGLETVYAPLTVGHMFTGKAYARSIRGHFLSCAALLSIICEEFYVDLSEKEQKQLSSIFESSNPEQHKSEPVALKLTHWFTNEKTKLAEKSRTAKLWLNYTEYVEIVQQFITAERTHNWPLHVSTTKNMINLFAATGHNNYAKTCRLYLQSIETLEKEHSLIHEQFILGNHCVRRTEKIWSGIWTDLSIEQILMRSLKGRGGVIGKGITENVLNVWTKTMHRCAEV